MVETNDQIPLDEKQVAIQKLKELASKLQEISGKYGFAMQMTLVIDSPRLVIHDTAAIHWMANKYQVRLASYPQQVAMIDPLKGYGGLYAGVLGEWAKQQLKKLMEEYQEELQSRIILPNPHKKGRSL